MEILSKISIRKALPGDIDSLVPLLHELFSMEKDFTPDREKQRRGLSLLMEQDSAYIFVAEAEGLVVGMCSVQVLISTAEGATVGLVEDVVVKNGYRGKGIGRALLAALDEWAGRNHIPRLQLLADRDNDSGLDFYRHLGWSGTSLICLRKKFVR